MGWTEYPDSWASTNAVHGYQLSTVQSVHDGVLDFYLHDDPATGDPVGADSSPLPGGNRYQTYGAWSFCERIDATDSYDLADFHQALLWPQNTTDWPAAESDFPEADVNATPSPGGPWWSASYYVDGQLVGTSKNQVWQGPERC
jgi:hypothetical protein